MSPAQRLRGVAITAAVGFFLAFAGAFGTSDAPFGRRLAYWLVLMVLGHVLGSAIAQRVFTPRGEGFIDWRRVGLAALLMSAPFTLVVAVATRLAFDARLSLATAPVLWASVLVVSLGVITIHALVEARHALASRAAAPGAPAPPRFLDRLPLRLRGAEVWAVEAEDHYLRLHTSRGQDLILMRLADAVAELDGIEGMQVHRSWWIARDAIADARRGDGRATLKLKDGSEVPVSRTYAGQLRAKGWI